MEFKDCYKIGVKNGGKWEYTKRLLTKTELLELVAEALDRCDKITIQPLMHE